jgi:hypothetical protein
MIVRDFEPLDLERIRPLRPISAAMAAAAGEITKAGPCWSAVQDGAVLASAGFVLHWPGRVGTWCVIGRDFPAARWVWLTHQVRRGLSQAQIELGAHRIEAEALTGWAPGARWLKLLGFTHEAPMPGYGEDGTSFDRWAKVRTHG